MKGVADELEAQRVSDMMTLLSCLDLANTQFSQMQSFVTRARASTEPQDNLNASRLAEGTISAIFEVPSKNLKSNLKR